MKTAIILFFMMFLFGCSNQVEEKYPNGNIKAKGDKINNLMEGYWQFFWENGNIKGEGSYIHGDGSNPGESGIPRNGKNGEWKFYYENGKLNVEQNINEGELLSELKYNENGDEIGSLLLDFDQDLYYSTNIGKEFAIKFSQYLASNVFNDNNETTSSMALDKKGDTYTFFVVAKMGIENDSDNIRTMKLWAQQLSLEFFDGNKVDIAIVDENFNVKRVVIY